MKEEYIMKLKQLDRIEYRQRYILLKQEEPKFSFFPFLMMIGTIFYIFLLGVILLETNHPDSAAHLMNLIPLLSGVLRVLIFLVILYGLLYFYLSLLWIKKRNVLEKEYFKVEVKK